MNGLSFAWYAAYRLIRQEYAETLAIHGMEIADDIMSHNMVACATSDVIFGGAGECCP